MEIKNIQKLLKQKILFNYYFREDSYNDNVDLVEKHTGKIMAIWPLYKEKFNEGCFKHRFYSINEM